jgi:Flp pilus assembly pilin Flp
MMSMPAPGELRSAGHADERGATAIEYGFLITFIGLLIIGGATALGQQIDAFLAFAAGLI